MRTLDLIVIGSGPAGQRAAIQAAKLGKEVAIVEKRRDLGGVCVNTGTLPSKTLREAVLDLSGLRQRTLYGEASFADRDVEAPDLLSRAERILSSERDVVRAQLRRNRVRVHEGTARFAGPHEVIVQDGDRSVTLEGRFVVIATGTAPHVPNGIRVDHETVLTSDDILSLRSLPRRMVVVGAGIIGVEYATLFAALGVKVTLVDGRTDLLDMVDRELVAALVQQAGALGVTFRLGEQVAGIDAGPLVVLESGKRIAADLVLLSAGRNGATAELGLEQIGIAPDARGRIPVNASFQTAVPHVYAVGDLIGYPALASTAMEQGRRAACHAFGLACASIPDLFPFGIYSIPEIAWVGPTEAELTRRGVPFGTGVARYREIARGQILGDPDGMLKLLFDLDTRRVLGVWILGTQATELVHVGQAVIAMGGTLDYFVDTVFNYPTLAECYKVAALDGYNQLQSLGGFRAGGSQAEAA